MSREEIRRQIQAEVNDRKTFLDSFSRLKLQIQSDYRPLHPSIYQFRPEFLHPILLSSQQNCHEFLQEHLVNSDLRLYQFPVFTDDFLRQFNEELKHFSNSNLPQPRPNTMNKNGVVVDLMGFQSFISQLRVQFLDRLAKSAFPEWTGDGLDSHKSFTIAYGDQADSDLAFHFDNAEVTLNVCLFSSVANNESHAGDLYFGEMYDRSLAEMKCQSVTHMTGWGYFHRGRQFHGAMKIPPACDRRNLIIWMRSSSVRNQLCPMCANTPDLFMASESDFGDGFTRSSVSVCTLI